MARAQSSSTPKKNPAATLRLTEAQVAAFRLARHHLLSARGNDPVAVCRAVCGIQAQLRTAAHMNIAARTRGLSPARIEAALWRDRTLVKCLCMRQTVHLLPASEFHEYAVALRRSRVAAVVRIMDRFRITPADRDALLRATLDELAPGPLTNRELTLRVRPRVSAPVRAWMDRVWNSNRLALVEGLICYGPDQGRQVTFVRVDQWLPARRPIGEDAAMRALIRKYLRAYGPATLRDFSHWSGIPVSRAKHPWDASSPERIDVSLSGRPASLLQEDLPALRGSSLRGRPVHLLAAFDPYLLAHAKKDHLLSPRHYKRVFRSLGWVAPVLLVQGLVADTWTHQVRGSRLELAISPFGPLSRPIRDGIAQQAETLAEFLDATAAIQYAPR